MLSKIITILAAIAEAWRQYSRKREQQQHEQKQQAVKEDPAVFFDDHFNGDANGLPDAADLPGNAAEADKAKPAEPDQKP